jgi:hypothetical protein
MKKEKEEGGADTKQIGLGRIGGNLIFPQLMEGSLGGKMECVTS